MGSPKSPTSPRLTPWTPPWPPRTSWTFLLWNPLDIPLDPLHPLSILLEAPLDPKTNPNERPVGQLDFYPWSCFKAYQTVQSIVHYISWTFLGQFALVHHLPLEIWLSNGPPPLLQDNPLCPLPGPDDRWYVARDKKPQTITQLVLVFACDDVNISF